MKKLPIAKKKKEKTKEKSSSSSGLSRAERMKQKQKQYNEGGKKRQYFNLKDGEEERIRILPPDNLDDDWYLEAYIHRNIGPEKDTVYCSKHTPGGSGECAICEKVKELYDEGTDESKTAATKTRAVVRGVANILVEGESAARLWFFSKTTASKVLALFTNPDYGNIDHPKKGHWLTIRRDGTFFDTDYTIQPRPQKTAIPDAENVLKTKFALEEVPNCPTYEETEELVEFTDWEALGKKKEKSGKDKNKKKKRHGASEELDED